MSDRPYIDPEVDSHEGYSDADLADLLEALAQELTKRNMHVAASDVAAAARRLRERT